MHICSPEKASVFRRHFAKPAVLKRKTKGMARAEDFQGQDFPKKRKKKRKHKEYNSQHGNNESGGDPELGQASPLLFENTAEQDGEGSRKKKRAQNKGKKQQASIADYCVRMDQEITNGSGVEASQKKKKRRQECSESTDEQSDVTCVLVNQHGPGGCQDDTLDYVYIKKPPKKKKRKAKLPEVGEEHEEPPSQRGSENGREKPRKKKKKRRGSSAQDGQGDTDGAADQSLLSSPGQNRPGGDKGSPLPAQEGQRHKGGDSDATSATSELSVEVPADFSTPSKVPDRVQKTPGRARKTIKSSAFVMEESFSESEETTPEPSASNKMKNQNSSFADIAASDEVSLDDDDEYLDSLTSSFMDLDTARQELKEFIPHVENISDGTIKKMVGRDLARFKEFKKQGIPVKFGRFTQKENNQIRKNVEEFLTISGLDSAEKLLFTSRYPEDTETVRRLKAEHKFCAKISEGIPRPWRLIYYRARKMFDPNNYKGRYTKEEKEQLKKYQAMHGNDWKKISELMSRSNLSVAMKFSEIKSAINYGPWTKEEIQKLKHAVKEVIRKKVEMEEGRSPSSVEQPDRDVWVERDKLCQQLPWTEIETKVGSRYWRQCKQKWNSILVKKMSKGQQVQKWIKRLQDKISLIKRLYEMNVEDANEVNWEKLADAIGDVPTVYLQTQFYKLKVSFVPFWQNKTFSEIIDYLFQYKLPELEERLRNKHLSSDDLSASQEKKAFRLSDIFDSSEESD